MALNLNLPAPQESSMIVAETRPRKISQSLESLDKQKPLDVASYLYTELEILNRQEVSPSDRIQALDTYRPLLISVTQTLAEDYCNASLPLHDNAKLAAASVESLWLELGYGYKLAIIGLQNKLIKIGSSKSSAHAIQRAIHAVAEHAFVYYQTYTSPPDHIWGDLHQLYFCAVQLGIQHTKVKAEKTDVESLTSVEFSIENTYIHALLMSLAEPQHLTQKDMRLTADFLAHHVNHVQITTVTPIKSTSGAFIVSLKSNKPPIPYSKQKEAPDPDTDILLQTIDLVRIIHQHFNSLQNSLWPKDGSIPSNGNRNDYIDLMTHLIKYWGVIPKRVYNRTQKNGEIELVAGISAIHKSINSQENNHAHINPNSIQPEQLMPSRWQILNISASGMSIRRHPTADKNIKIGSILGIKTKDDQHWSLGLVRWANCGNRDRLDIGVQLIAPQAQSAIAQISGREYDEMVLVLPEIAAANQATSIIAPKGTYEPARALTLTYSGISKHVICIKIIDRSNHFERIQYSVIN